MRRLAAFVSALVLASTAVAAAPSTTFASPTYAIEVSHPGPIREGETLTLTPVVTGVEPGTRLRCVMIVEGFESEPGWVRMQVSSDACTPWTFTLPPSVPGTYRIWGRLAVGRTDGGVDLWALAPEQTLEVASGGIPAPFSSNYPVQSWSLSDVLSTEVPRYGEALTIYPPNGVESCDLGLRGGFEYTTVHERDACEPWTVTISPRVLEVPIEAFGDSSNVQIMGWSGESTWDDERPGVGLVGTVFAETYVGVPAFADGPPTAGYTSNLPAIFWGPGRYPVAYANDPSSLEIQPVVVDADGGTCTYRMPDIPVPTPVESDLCRDPVVVPPWLEPTNGYSVVYVDLTDASGRVVASASTGIGYVLPLADVEVDAPAVAEPGEEIEIEASTAEGVPATYVLTAAPEAADVATAWPSTALLAGMRASVDVAATATTIASGEFSPTLETVGDAVSANYAFPSAGRYRITATFTDVKGQARSSSAVIEIASTDTTKPTTSALSAAATGLAVSGGVPYRLTWTGADSGSGVAHYDVQRSIDGGVWATLASPTNSALDTVVAAGVATAFRVRAIDRAGNTGAWSGAITVKPDWATRQSGANRYATAAAISKAAFAPGVPVAYVAFGLNYPDALAAGPAAARLGGPVLLSATSAIPAETAAELTRLKPGRIVVVGGPSVVSDAVLAALRKYTSGTVSRQSGANRYATAAAISKAAFAPGVPVAYVAFGLNYPDALAAGPAAARLGGPVLLSATSAIPAETAAELTRLKPGRIVVVGGPSVVSDAVLAALRKYTSGTVSRQSGANRYATAAAISKAAFAPGVPVAYVAFGLNYPDALAAGPAAARLGGPVLLSATSAIPAETAAELTRLKPGRIVVVGGPSVVSDAVLAALRKLR